MAEKYIPDPSPEELREFFEERARNFPDEREPTSADINAALRKIAEKAGATFELDDASESDNDLIARLRIDGWRYLDTIENIGIATEARAGKEVKIVGRGKRFLMFERNQG